MRWLIVLLLCTSISSTCFSQIVVSGSVLNRDTKAPIPFVNIGIVRSGTGTLSNEDGSFKLPMSGSNLNDSLTFSAIGFGTRKVSVKYLLDNHGTSRVWLHEKTAVLDEVVITAQLEKNKLYEAGNRSFNGGVLETDTTYAGRSIALLINQASNPDVQFPVYIQQASIRIFRNNLPSFKFRVRLNAVDPLTSEPGTDILQKSIVMESSIRNGWLAVDLSHLNQIISGPFFITFEQILDVHDRTRIADGYRDYIREHRNKLKIDTVVFEGKKEAVTTLRGGIDLPGTFVAISTSKSTQYNCYVRETSLAPWKKVRGILTAFVTLSNQSPVAVGNKPTEELCDSVACKIARIAQNFLDETGMNGLQLAVCKKGNKAVSISLGLADANTRVTVGSQTRFRINSISKSLTAAALIKLVEAGKLDLDVPVQKYLGEFPNINYPITTRQLAGHLAGIRDYNEADPGDFVRTEHYQNASDALQVVRNDSLLFAPGTRFHYSTFGWSFIGAVIEAVTKTSYGDMMDQILFDPLGLDHTGLDDIAQRVPERSKFYDAAGNENDYGDWSYKYAGGGLLSTADDLALFGSALLNGSYFDASLKAQLFRSQQTSDKKETGYGIGWYVGHDKRGNRIWHHSGDSFSSSSHLIIYPEQNIVIAFLGNAQAGAAFDWQQIAELVLASQ